MDKKFFISRQGRQFVLYAGLLDEAHAHGLKAIRTQLSQVPSDANGNVAICHAIVETDCGTFEAFGDAAPNNVARNIVPHLIRMAETRAKARALRDAINVGVLAAEETEDDDQPQPQPEPGPNGHKATANVPKAPPTLGEIRAGYAKLSSRLAELHVAIPPLAPDANADQASAQGRYWKQMLPRCEASGVFGSLVSDWLGWAAQARALGLPVEQLDPDMSDLSLANGIASLSNAVRQAERAVKTAPAAGPSQLPQTAQPPPGGSTATPAQVKAIYAIASHLGWSDSQTASYAQTRHQSPVEQLSKGDASKLIDDLKAKQGEANDEHAV